MKQSIPTDSPQLIQPHQSPRHHPLCSPRSGPTLLCAESHSRALGAAAEPWRRWTHGEGTVQSTWTRATHCCKESGYLKGLKEKKKKKCIRPKIAEQPAVAAAQPARFSARLAQQQLCLGRPKSSRKVLWVKDGVGARGAGRSRRQESRRCPAGTAGLAQGKCRGAAAPVAQIPAARPSLPQQPPLSAGPRFRIPPLRAERPDGDPLTPACGLIPGMRAGRAADHSGPEPFPGAYRPSAPHRAALTALQEPPPRPALPRSAPGGSTASPLPPPGLAAAPKGSGARGS